MEMFNKNMTKKERFQFLEEYSFYVAHKELYDNLSVVFSGYNIINEIKLAVKSFLYFYPYLSKNIVIFDDNSTDGTREWAEENGYKVITWLDDYKEFATNYETFVSEHHYNLCYSYKVDVMYNVIMQQLDTKYMMLNDGDVCFYNFFLKKEFSYILEGYKMVVPISRFGADFKNEQEKFFNEYGKKYISRFYKMYAYFYTLENRNAVKDIAFRFHLFHCLIDIDYLKSIGMGIDDLDDPNLLPMSFPPVCDSGMNFTVNVLERKIPWAALHEYRNGFVLHLGFRSSLKQLVEKADISLDTSYNDGDIDPITPADSEEKPTLKQAYFNSLMCFFREMPEAVKMFKMFDYDIYNTV